MTILDAYAVIAYLRGEPAVAEVAELLRGQPLLTSVNAARVVGAYREALANEVLAVDISTTDLFPGAEVREVDVEAERVRLGITRAGQPPNA